MRLLICSLVLLAGCAPGSQQGLDRQAEERAIRNRNREWSDAAKRKDVEAILSFYAPGATAAFPNHPPAVGTDSLRSLWKSDLAIPGLLSLSWQPDHIELASSGDLASDFGRVYSEWQTPQGVVKSTDKYLTVWKKIDGGWKVLYDAWNTNAPMN